jgi:steroid 5-alpha reductase family enzyme
VIRFLVVSAVALGIAVVAMAVSVLAARRAGRVSVVDTTWGLALTGVAVASALVGDGDPVRRWLLVGLVGAWGLRLSWHMHRRNAGGGEDPRYAKILREGSALRKVWLPQGSAIWLVSLPVQVNAVADDDLTVLGWVGVAVWVVGVVFEAVGDAQLATYKRAVRAGQGDRGPVMDRGLWRWTRHPNYFGDATVWWGIWLVAAWPWPGLLTVVAPAAMTWFLVFATGARLLEQTMMQRPGYPEYAARTSMFVPLPPRS